MEKIRGILLGLLTGPNQPLIMIAGHIHIDHMYLGLTDRRLWNMARIIIAAEDWGADQLESGDLYWTGADVVDKIIPRTPVALRLATHEDRSGTGTRRVPIPGGDDIILISHPVDLDGSPFFGQSMPLADGDRVEFWHTPGHSRDSMTIRIGNLFHIGDIPFSTNPGIAGRPGWDRDALMRSVMNIRWLFGQGGQICCLGHGRSLNYDGTITMLNKLEKEILVMPDISVLNKERINVSMWHGLDLVEEAHRIFPVIAGRLMFLSYQLEKLGMDEEAGYINSLFEHEVIDTYFDEFNLFYGEYKSGNKVKPEVVMKILQVFERIQTSFHSDILSGIIDVSLIRRATRLFSDLLSTIQGIIPAGNPEQIELIPFIREWIIFSQSSGVSDSELIGTADDEILYRQAMVSRLAHLPHARRLLYHLQIIDETKGLVAIRADRNRLYDFFSALSEFFEGVSAERVEIHLICDPDSIRIIFTPEGPDIRYEVPIPGATQREVAYAGGRLMNVMVPGKEDVCIMFPAVI